MSDSPGRCRRWAGAGLALAALALAPWWARAGLAHGQQAAAGEGEAAGGREPAGDSVRARASRDRMTFIQDPRLAADSTLFPYEWPALDGLRLELASLRPALEAGAVQELADALPEVRVRADTLIASDSIPALLVPRRAEVRERLAALRDALGRVEELAPAALAAPPDTSGAEPEGFTPLEESPDSLGSPGAGRGAAPGAPPLPAEPAPAPPPSSGRPAVLEQPSELESPAGTPPPPGGLAPGAPAPDAGSAAEPTGRAAADSLAALDPVGAFLQAWRDVYAQEEALLHRVRDPFGE